MGVGDGICLGVAVLFCYDMPGLGNKKQSLFHGSLKAYKMAGDLSADQMPKAGLVQPGRQHRFCPPLSVPSFL